MNVDWNQVAQWAAVAVIVPVSVGVIIYLIQRYISRGDDSIRLKRLTSTSDRDVDGFLSLYAQHFGDSDADYTPEEALQYFVRMTEAKPRDVIPQSVDSIVILAKLKGTVVGLLICPYYPHCRRGLVAYLATHAEFSSRSDEATFLMLQDLIRRLASMGCHEVFYEIARSDRAIARLLSAKAKAHGFQAVEVPIDYKSPRPVVDEGRSSAELRLYVVKMSEPLRFPMRRSSVLGYLRFIYLECYGDIYRTDDHRYEQHRSNLTAMLQNYEDSLPDMILEQPA